MRGAERGGAERGGAERGGAERGGAERGGCARGLGASYLGELGQDLAGLGEAAGLVLRVDHLAVHLDVELPAPAGDELGLDAGLLPDRGRETRGLGLVASHHAVLDHDLHHRLLLVLVPGLALDAVACAGCWAGACGPGAPSNNKMAAPGRHHNSLACCRSLPLRWTDPS
jgi:hypothetical protein